MAFRGRVAAITGAASGIGKGLAVELARRGADLALCDIDEDGLAKTAAMVEAEGRRATTHRVDVADREAVYAFKDAVLERHGRADAIVNNAGVAVTDTVVDSTYEDLEWIFGINLWGVIHGTKAFLPHLIEQNDGWVVNVSSVFGLMAFPNQSAYNVTKFGVRGFTEALRQELAHTGVTATSVHPGGIRTNIARRGRFRRVHDGSIDEHEAVEEFEKRLARTTPEEAGRIIADGMERREPRILVGPDAHLIDRVVRLFPVRYTDIVERVISRQRKKRGR
jgi:NAD(P)-dependent dehydrogenase (short-subunit alcohol dehydrogenase family)